MLLWIELFSLSTNVDAWVMDEDEKDIMIDVYYYCYSDGGDGDDGNNKNCSDSKSRNEIIQMSIVGCDSFLSLNCGWVINHRCPAVHL